MDPMIARRFAAPDCFLHSVDGATAQFLPMNQAAYRRSIFLDHRISVAEGAPFVVDLANVVAAAPPLQNAGWIFHVAHCGSTLLARAIDELTGTLVLREPLALRQLAVKPDPQVLPAVLALLARRYPGAGLTVIKANVPVNFLLDRIALLNAEAPAILLYARLSDYLLAVLRSPNHRGWVRTISTQLAAHLGHSDATSDAELAAALWLAQLRRYVATLGSMPNARTLEAEHFYRDPAGTLMAAARLYGLSADEKRAAEIARGALFATYSKNPHLAFDNSARLARRSHLATELEGELTSAEGWVRRQGVDPAELVQSLSQTSLTG